MTICTVLTACTTTSGGSCKRRTGIQPQADPEPVEFALSLAGGTSLRYTPQYRNENLWVNGSYMGLYLLTEKVEIQKNRRALNEPGGVLVEMDNICFGEEDTWHASSVTGMHYVLKDTVDESDEAAFLRSVATAPHAGCLPGFLIFAWLFPA